MRQTRLALPVFFFMFGIRGGCVSSNKRTTKKDQIISLFLTGITEMEEISRMTQSRPSYVACVLQRAGFITGYFDLYTPTSQPANIYSKFFAGKLGFKDEETAYQSVSIIDNFYRQFESNKDRAGQHHALMMALTMYDRARWTHKPHEAEVFREWLLDHLKSDDNLSEDMVSDL